MRLKGVQRLRLQFRGVYSAEEFESTRVDWRRNAVARLNAWRPYDLPISKAIADVLLGEHRQPLR